MREGYWMWDSRYQISESTEIGVAFFLSYLLATKYIYSCQILCYLLAPDSIIEQEFTSVYAALEINQNSLENLWSSKQI
jgi:hypothetical protein